MSVLALTGDFDMQHMALLEKRLEELARRGHVRSAVCLRKAGFLGAAFVGVMLRMRRRFRDAGGELVLMDPPRILLMILRAVGLERCFRMTSSANQPIGGSPAGGGLCGPRRVEGIRADLAEVRPIGSVTTRACGESIPILARAVSRRGSRLVLRIENQRREAAIPELFRSGASR